MFLIAQLIVFLLMVAASKQDPLYSTVPCTLLFRSCNAVPPCHSGCKGGDSNNYCDIASGASTDISGSFQLGSSNQLLIYHGNSLKVADGASIYLDTANYFLAYNPGATIQLLKDAKINADNSNRIYFQWNSSNGPFTATFGESSMTTLGNGVYMEINGAFQLGSSSIFLLDELSNFVVVMKINGAFQLGSNSTFWLEASSSFLLAPSGRFVTGESVNVQLGPSSITTLNQGHQLEMSSNSFFSLGSQSSYTGLHGSKLQYLLPGIGIQIRRQANLVIKEHSFCLIQRNVTIPAQTTLILSSSGGLPDGVLCVASEAGMKELKEETKNMKE